MKFNITRNDSENINEAGSTDALKRLIADADNDDASALKDAYYGVSDNIPQLRKSALDVLGKNSSEYKTVEKIAALFDQLTLGKYL